MDSRQQIGSHIPTCCSQTNFISLLLNCLSNSYVLSNHYCADYLYISRLGRPSRPPNMFINIKTDPHLYSLSTPYSATPFQTSVAVHFTSIGRI